MISMTGPRHPNSPISQASIHDGTLTDLSRELGIPRSTLHSAAKKLKFACGRQVRSKKLPNMIMYMRESNILMKNDDFFNKFDIITYSSPKVLDIQKVKIIKNRYGSTDFPYQLDNI